MGVEDIKPNSRPAMEIVGVAGNNNVSAICYNKSIHPTKGYTMKYLLTASSEDIYTLIVEADSPRSAVELGWNTTKDHWEYETKNTEYDGTDWFISSVTPIVEIGE